MIQLREGDVFCTQGGMGAIRLVERVWAGDGRAEYGHSGLILSSTGRTLEALTTVRISSLDQYHGQPVLIARPTTEEGGEIHQAMIRSGIRTVSQRIGDRYPWWRLGLHLIPPLARLVGTGGNVVCSELVAEYLRLIGARSGPYLGVNPDTLADEWRRWKNFEIIFEGIYEKTIT